MEFDPSQSVHPADGERWKAWLEANHERANGVWLVAYKKGTGKPAMSYDESVEIALCYGWVDSKPTKIDDERHGLWFSPRKSKSGWSKINKERVERLIAAGRMAPAGLAKVREAQKDGSWSSLDAVEALEVPRDLEAEFARYPDARRNFEAFPRSVVKGILDWISQAKKSDTRAARVEETARLAQENVRANQWKDKRKAQ